MLSYANAQLTLDVVIVTLLILAWPLAGFALGIVHGGKRFKLKYWKAIPIFYVLINPVVFCFLYLRLSWSPPVMLFGSILFCLWLANRGKAVLNSNS